MHVSWRCCRNGLSVIGTLLCIESPLAAQKASYVVVSQLSLAWWQMNPHLNHLWATTCTRDPDWRPGEGAGMSQAQAILKSMQKRVGDANVLDTIIPLYPRKKVLPICGDAVGGAITVEDAGTLSGAKGTMTVKLDALQTGFHLHDSFMHEILGVTKNSPPAEFRIDSLSGVQRGDTTRAIAHGTLQLHAAVRSFDVPLKMWQTPEGLRVTGRFSMPALDMVDVYHLSRFKLGLGVGAGIWKFLYMGFDVILKEQ
jgi:hypothetical protein